MLHRRHQHHPIYQPLGRVVTANQLITRGFIGIVTDLYRALGLEFFTLHQAFLHMSF